MYTYEYNKFGSTLEIFKDGESIFFIQGEDASELDDELQEALRADERDPGEISCVQLILSAYDY